MRKASRPSRVAGEWKGCDPGIARPTARMVVAGLLGLALGPATPAIPAGPRVVDATQRTVLQVAASSSVPSQMEVLAFEPGGNGQTGRVVLELRRTTAAASTIELRTRASAVGMDFAEVEGERRGGGCERAAACDTVEVHLRGARASLRLVAKQARRGMMLLFSSPVSGVTASRGVRFKSVELGRRLEPDVDLEARPAASGAFDLRARVEVEGRRYALTTRYSPPAGRPTPDLRVVAFATLVELLHEVAAVEAQRPTPRSTGADTDEPPPLPGGDDWECGLCGFCQDLPGGHTLEGCLGGHDGGGGGGGGGAPAPTPTPTPAPTPPPCRVTRVEAAKILVDMLQNEFAFLDFCKSGVASLGAPEDLFPEIDRDYFDLARAAAPDPSSAACAECFRRANDAFSQTSTVNRTLRRQLSPKCIRSFTALSLPANAAEFATVKATAAGYRDRLKVCKESCDTGAVAHRAYCDCRPLYLDYLPAPHPGDAACVP